MAAGIPFDWQTPNSPGVNRYYLRRYGNDHSAGVMSPSWTGAGYAEYYFYRHMVGDLGRGMVTERLVKDLTDPRTNKSLGRTILPGDILFYEYDYSVGNKNDLKDGGAVVPDTDGPGDHWFNHMAVVTQSNVGVDQIDAYFQNPTAFANTMTSEIRFASHTSGGEVSFNQYTSPKSIRIYRIVGYYPEDVATGNTDIRPGIYEEDSYYLQIERAVTHDIASTVASNYYNGQKYYQLTIQSYQKFDATGSSDNQPFGYCTNMFAYYNGYQSFETVSSGGKITTANKSAVKKALFYGLTGNSKTAQDVDDINYRLGLTGSNALLSPTEAYYVTQMAIWYALGYLNYSGTGNITLSSSVTLNGVSFASGTVVAANVMHDAEPGFPSAAQRVLNASKRIIDIIAGRGGAPAVTAIDPSSLGDPSTWIKVTSADSNRAAYNETEDAYIAGPYTVEDLTSGNILDGKPCTIQFYSRCEECDCEDYEDCQDCDCCDGEICQNDLDIEIVEKVTEGTSISYEEKDTLAVGEEFWIIIPKNTTSEKVKFKVTVKDVGFTPVEITEYQTSAEVSSAVGAASTGNMQGVLIGNPNPLLPPSASGEADLELVGGFCIQKTINSQKPEEGTPDPRFDGFSFMYWEQEGTSLVEPTDTSKITTTSATTGGTGKIEVYGLTPGTYVVKEVDNHGATYILPDPVTIDVVAEDVEEIDTYYINNISNSGGFTINKIAKNMLDEDIDYSGFEFEIYKGVQKIVNGKNTIDGTEFNVTINPSNGKTPVSGIITADGLPRGTYTVKEVNLSKDFIVPVPSERTVSVTAGVMSDNGQAHYVSFTNVQKPGELTITKLTDDPDGEKSVVGAKFNIHFVEDQDNSNDEIAEIKSGNSVTVSRLRLGVYEITETAAPEGFKADKTVYTVTVDAAHVVAPNDPDDTIIRVGCEITNYSQLGKFCIIKKNSTTNEMDDEMTGTVFNIYPSGKTYNSAQDNEKQQLTISSEHVPDGAETKFLPLGEYIIEEITAPDGYVLSAVKAQTVILAYQQGLSDDDDYEAVEVTFTNNPQLGQITVYKTGNCQNTNGACGESDIADGAEFEIRSGSAEGEVVETLVLDGVTSKASQALPLGIYYVIETKAPKGYVLDETPQKVEIQYNAEKQDVEVLTEAEDSALKVTLTNEIISGKISLKKYSDVVKNDSAISDISDLEVLKGVKFQVYLKSAGSYNSANENERDEITTDENGFTSTKDLPYGTYVIREIEVPEGYMRIDGDLHLYPGEDLASIDWDLEKYESANKVSEINISSNSQIYSYLLVNKSSPPGTGGIRIVKTFENIDLNEDLSNFEGLEFVVEGKPEGGDPYFEVFSIYHTGIINVEGLLPGVYKIRELESDTVALDYTVAEEITVEVEIGVLKEAPIENKLVRADILLAKVGSNNLNKPLFGAKFNVYADVEKDIFDEVTHYIGTMTEDEDAVHRLEGLVCGKYFVKEVEVPQGYEIDRNEYPFEISRGDNGKTIVIFNGKDESEQDVFVNEKESTPTEPTTEPTEPTDTVPADTTQPPTEPTEPPIVPGTTSTVPPPVTTEPPETTVPVTATIFATTIPAATTAPQTTTESKTTVKASLTTTSPPSSPKSPQTSDPANMLKWVIMILMSMAVLSMVILKVNKVKVKEASVNGKKIWIPKSITGGSKKMRYRVKK